MLYLARAKGPKRTKKRRERAMAELVDRMLRAAKLDESLYEEVEKDQTAMPQAMAVVVIASVAGGVGSLGAAGLSGLFLGLVASLVGWFVWALLTYFIGTRLLPEPQTKADLGELLRTIGFSSSPGVIRVLGFIPFLGGIILFAASIWMLVAMVVAVRQALDYQSTGRAVGVCLIGWIVQVVLYGLLFSIVGGPG
jgi:hypothetical protein